jgi:hypothetical protein
MPSNLRVAEPLFVKDTIFGFERERVGLPPRRLPEAGVRA